MAEQKNYFGKNDIRPTFPGTKKPEQDPALSARDSLKSAESSAVKPTSDKAPAAIKPTAGSAPATLANTLEKTSLFTGQGKPKDDKKKKRSRSRLLKAAPAALLVIVLVVGLLLIFGSSSMLGPHLSALFTEATDTGYTGYNLRTQEVMVDVLDGKIEFTDYFKERLEKNNIHVNGNTLEYNGTAINSGNFKAMYNGDANFRQDFNFALRSRSNNFFDNAAQQFYQKLGLSRDVFHDYTATGDNNTDTSAYNSLLSDLFDHDSNASAGGAEEFENEDDDGNIFIDYRETAEEKASTSELEGSSEDKAKEYLDEIAERVAEEEPGCTALKIGDMVSVAIEQDIHYQNAHDYMYVMENISKAMYGDGANSAINSVLNWFTTPASSEIYDPATGETYTSYGTPLEAEGMRIVLGDLSADQSKSEHYSMEQSFIGTKNSIASSGLSIGSCDTARAAGTLISLATLSTPGAGFIKTTVGVLLGTALELGVKISASSVLSLLVPEIAKVMFENSYNKNSGITGGENFAAGGANVNMLLAQHASGASTGSRSAVLGYNRATEEVLAKEAEEDRLNRSPFDITSKNTFLGSIISSFLPQLSTSASLFAHASTLTSSTGVSLASLSPAYAAGENTSLMTNFGPCNQAEEIGAAGNIYCKAVAMLDLSEIDKSVDDGEYQAVISESLDGDEIKDGSPLAGYIAYWMGRYSSPGFYDANIAKACKEDTRTIPFLSDIAEMAKALMGNSYCQSVADGSRYVASEDNPYWETEKYHQLYVLTERIKAHMGVYGDGDDPVTAYKKHYEETHPLDNSRSGYLARITGLSKDDAAGVLALVDYAQKIANYDASAAFAFGEGSNTATRGDATGGLPKISDRNFWEGDVAAGPRVTILEKKREVYIV